jgi:hypothetical protein
MDTDTRISVIAGRPGAGKTRWAAREVVETLRDVNNVVIYIGFDREFERICRMVSDTYGSKPHHASSSLHCRMAQGKQSERPSISPITGNLACSWAMRMTTSTRTIGGWCLCSMTNAAMISSTAVETS